MRMCSCMDRVMARVGREEGRTNDEGRKVEEKRNAGIHVKRSH